MIFVAGHDIWYEKFGCHLFDAVAVICNDVGEIRFIREDGSVCRVVACLASSMFPGGRVR